MSRGNLCLFEPVQVVCLESREAHVVAAGAPVAGRAGGAGHAYFVGSLSDPVTPGRQKHVQCQWRWYQVLGEVMWPDIY